MATIETLERRIISLERSVHNVPTDRNDIVIDEQIRRARSAVESSRCYSSVWKWVPPEYYSLPLEGRRDILGAMSTYQLCKSMLMENRNCNRLDCVDRTNSRYYLVVVQYESSIDATKLASEVRGLRPPGIKSGRLEPGMFDFRVASEVDNDRLTGYVPNSVTPFGLRDSSVPIVLAKDITKLDEPKFMWMGGGHVDLKLGMEVDEFIRATDALVLDC